MNACARAVLAIAVSLLLGCSDDNAGTTRNESSKERLLKEQTDAIDKARDVGRQLGEAAARKDAAQQ